MKALVLGLLPLLSLAVAAQETSRPPCPSAPPLSFPELGSPPNIKVWSDREPTSDWAPPACIDWPAKRFRVVVELAGRFWHDGGADELLARFGTISAARGIRYWSTTDKDWRVLITDTAAVEGADGKRRRSDFTVAEMKSGADLYFAQTDNRATNEVIYRMRLLVIAPDRFVIAIENVSPVHLYVISLFKPGDLHSVYVLERRSPSAWGYYSLGGIGEGASPLAELRPSSYVNRAVALYRHISGIPTDQDPPMAP